MVLLLPLIGHALAERHHGGFITGVCPNTPQCVAIAHAYSEAAGAVATIVKSVKCFHTGCYTSYDSALYT